MIWYQVETLEIQLKNGRSLNLYRPHIVCQGLKTWHQLALFGEEQRRVDCSVRLLLVGRFLPNQTMVQTTFAIMTFITKKFIMLIITSLKFN